MKHNQTLWETKLRKGHNTFWKQAYKRLMKKLSTLKANLYRRSDQCDVACDITLDELKDMCFKVYNKPCKYCNRTLTYHNIACDHIIPIAKEGPSTLDNLQFICKTCNTRKGPLLEKDYIKLINWISIQTLELKEYLLRKLAKGGKW